MQLVLVGLGGVEYLDVRVLHPDGQPLAGGAVTEGEYLRGEIMLLQLPAFAKVPGAHGVVEATGPQFRSVGGDVDAGRAVRVTLELPDQRLILQVPHGDIAVAAATEADLRVRRDRQGIACGRRRSQFCFNSGRRTR